MVGFFAIRGATTVEENTKEEILRETTRLLREICEENGLKQEEIVSIFFTMTPDLNATFPAEAARELGLNRVPLLCSAEIDVRGAITKCIRVLIHTTGEKDSMVQHMYLNRARDLRPDWSQDERSDRNESST